MVGEFQAASKHKHLASFWHCSSNVGTHRCLPDSTRHFPPELPFPAIPIMATPSAEWFDNIKKGVYPGLKSGGGGVRKERKQEAPTNRPRRGAKGFNADDEDEVMDNPDPRPKGQPASASHGPTAAQQTPFGETTGHPFAATSAPSPFAAAPPAPTTSLFSNPQGGGRSKGKGKGKGWGTTLGSDQWTGALGVFVSRHDSFLREDAARRNWILRASVLDAKQKQQAFREHWLANIQEAGAHPWGGPEQFAWQCFLRLHYPIEEGDCDPSIKRLHQVLEHTLGSVSTFRPVLQRPIKRGYPEKGEWLWALSFKSRAQADLESSTVFYLHTELWGLLGTWKQDAAPESKDVRILREGLRGLNLDS